MKLTDVADPDSLIRRFFAKVEKTDGCWLWTGSRKAHNGYGQLAVHRRYIPTAHRVSYLIHFGEVPDHLLVCHTCDNRACVNPDHLFLGTHQDNYDDMAAKGRRVVTPNRGTRNGNSRLNEDAVRGIRQSLSEGVSERMTAARFGVSRATVHAIKEGRMWGWLS